MYFKNHYKTLTEAEIKRNIVSEGFNPIKYTNPAGFIYPEHKHPETKLLAFLKGDMDILVDNQQFTCAAGDKLIIPGNIKHSAIVGRDGCSFFWAEKLL